MAQRFPSGVFPTMITPFTADGSAIDWPKVDGALLLYSVIERSSHAKQLLQDLLQSIRAPSRLKLKNIPLNIDSI